MLHRTCDAFKKYRVSAGHHARAAVEVLRRVLRGRGTSLADCDVQRVDNGRDRFGPLHLPGQSAVFVGLLVAAGAVLAISLGLLWLSEPLTRVLGVTGANVAGRLSGVILGALAVQFVIEGLRHTFAGGSQGSRMNARSHTSWPRRSPRTSKRVGRRSAGRGMKDWSADRLRKRGQAFSTSRAYSA